MTGTEQRSNNKHAWLLEDNGVKRWIKNIESGSIITAEVSLRRLGMLYCTKCAVSYRIEASHCFCCGCTLRYKSRAAKYRKRR